MILYAIVCAVTECFRGELLMIKQYAIVCVLLSVL